MQDKQGHKESRDKYSLRGKVFESIREDILSGRYEQNTELKETAIGAELGVSRTPVREALRQLELEGLVIYHSQPGSICEYDHGQGCAGYLRDPFHAGRLMCQMGD